MLSFGKPKDALYKKPGKVTIEDGQIQFFEDFSPGRPTTAETELEAYIKTDESKLLQAPPQSSQRSQSAE